MNNNTRNAFAHHALEILKMSTLEALYKRSTVESHVRQLKILGDLGIPEIAPSGPERRSLIYGILLHLQEDGYAKDLGNGRWKITEEGVSVIENSQYPRTLS